MTLKRLALATGACLVALPSASAFAQDPPGNDHYLQSLPFNESGRAGDPPPVDRELADSPNTTAATEQGDVFNPPGSGGPPELLACEGVPYGKTVWYDVYPNLNGNLRVLAGATFDPVIALYTFVPGNPVPNFLGCLNATAGPTEELIIPIRRGTAYTIQIGGVNGAGGPAENRFGFFRTEVPRVRADATLRATATASGIRVSSLRVTGPRGGRVRVTCTRRGCRPQTLRSRNDAITRPLGTVSPATASASSKDEAPAARAASAPRAQAARTVSVTRLRGRRLRAGQAIVIRVTRPNAIGAYIKYTIRRGNFTKSTRCMNPGSTVPRRRCSG